MIERLVLLGATGDLTARYLLPGLVALRSGGHIGDGFRLVAVGREDWRDEEFRNWASAQLDQYAQSFSATARHAVISASEYHRADVTDAGALSAVTSGAEPVAAYLALHAVDLRRHRLGAAWCRPGGGQLDRAGKSRSARISRRRPS